MPPKFKMKKLDVNEVIKGRHVGVLAVKQQEVVSRDLPKDLLHNQDGIHEARQYVEKLHRETWIPIKPQHFGKVCYFLSRFYFVEYLVRISFELFLKVFQWPYPSAHLIKNLLSPLDVQYLMTAFPKILRTHHAEPTIIGYCFAVMGCMADVDCRSFGLDEQLLFHSLLLTHRHMKVELVLINMLLFMQRLVAPSAVDFYISADVLRMRAAMLKLPADAHKRWKDVFLAGGPPAGAAPAPDFPGDGPGITAHSTSRIELDRGEDSVEDEPAVIPFEMQGTMASAFGNFKEGAGKNYPPEEILDANWQKNNLTTLGGTSDE